MRLAMAMLVIVLAAAGSPQAGALSFDHSPRPAFLLKSGHLIAQSTQTAATLYDLKGQAIRSFDLGQHLARAVAVSPDERYLAAVGWEGRVRIWWIDDGSRCADLVLPGSGGGSNAKAAFSLDSGVLIVQWGDASHVVRSADGVVMLPATEQPPALSVPGTHRGAPRVHFQPDGSALVIATELPPPDPPDARPHDALYRRAAGSDDLALLVKVPVLDPRDYVHGYLMDADPERNLGVTTDWDLRTRLVDLRTGETTLTIDNSENMPGPFGFLNDLCTMCWVGIAGLGLIAVIMLVLTWRAGNSAGS